MIFYEKAAFQSELVREKSATITKHWSQRIKGLTVYEELLFYLINNFGWVDIPCLGATAIRKLSLVFHLFEYSFASSLC